MTQNKKVWIVSSNRWNSAVSEYALSAACSLREAGWEVVFSPLKESPAQDRAAVLDVKVLSIAHFRSPFPMMKVAAKVKPEHVILLGGPETFHSKFCKVFFGGKYHRVWAEAGKETSRLGGWRGRLRYGHLKGFITPSNFLQEKLKAYLSSDVKNILLGVNEQKFKRSEAMVGSFLRKRPQIVILGRLDPVKGHKEAIFFLKIAFERWRDAHRRPCLHIVGEPKNVSAEQIKAWVNEAGLVWGDDVVLTPQRVDSITALLNSSILGLICSLDSELICRVGEEFLMCGVPVVVSGVGALNELLVDKTFGESYLGKNTDEEKARVVMNWVDTSLSEGELAKRKRSLIAREHFGFEAMGKNLSDFLLS